MIIIDCFCGFFLFFLATTMTATTINNVIYYLLYHIHSFIDPYNVIYRTYPIQSSIRVTPPPPPANTIGNVWICFSSTLDSFPIDHDRAPWLTSSNYIIVVVVCGTKLHYSFGMSHDQLLTFKLIVFSRPMISLTGYFQDLISSDCDYFVFVCAPYYLSASNIINCV